ncbi:MAG: hypothetical protein ACYDDW_15155 [Dermatophilaceae bacterium]
MTPGPSRSTTPSSPATHLYVLYVLYVLVLPANASFGATQQDQGWNFAVRPAQGAGDQLRGTVRTA